MRHVTATIGMKPAQLFDAVRRDSLREVKQCLKAGVKVNSKDAKGMTPLHWAAGAGLIEIVTYLLDKGAKPDVPDKDGMTPLHWAAVVGHADVVTYLLDKGAKPDVQNQGGVTPLQMIVDSMREGKERFPEIIEWFRQTHPELVMDLWMVE